jgi:hypothetical protein
MIVVLDGNDGFTLPAAEDVGRLSTLGTTRHDSSRRSEKKGTSAITFGNACNPSWESAPFGNANECPRGIFISIKTD